MKNRAIDLFMWIAATSVASNIYLLIPIYSAVAEGLSITYEEVIFSSTLFTFCYALGLLSFGPISEYFSKKRVLFFGMLASSLLTFVITFSNSLLSFYLIRSFQGYVLGSFAPVAYAYCFDVFHANRRSFVIAVINMGFLMAGILGQLISSSLVAAYDWRGIFYFLGCIYILLAFSTLFTLPSVPHSFTKSSSKETSIFSSKLLQPSIILGLSITFVTLMSFVAFYDELAQHYTGEEEALFYSRCIGLVGTPLSLLCGNWLKKHKAKKMLLICLSIIIISLLLMLLTNNLVMITLLSTLYVSAIAVFIPSLITFIGEAAAKKRAAAISLYSFTLLIGASLGPIVANVLSFQSVISLFSILFGLAFIILLFTKNHLIQRG
jgi:MFS transporter, YNFM family, putative membrane transport protein